MPEEEEPMIPELSPGAWALLVRMGRERRKERSTTTSPALAPAYSELVGHGLVRARRITPEGETFLAAHPLRAFAARRPRLARLLGGALRKR
jgi:hypothetical protein